MITFGIRKPANFSFEECRWFLDRNFDDCMHRVTGQSVLKPISRSGKPVLFELFDGGGELIVNILRGSDADSPAVEAYVKEWLDLERDIRPFYRLLKRDPELAPLYSRYQGLRLIGIPDLFELLCWCVIGQQINLEFAYKVKRKLVESYGRRFIHDKQVHWLFPEPERLASLSVTELRTLQLTTRKAEYILGIAELFAEGELSKEKILALKDERTMKESLMHIRGIGEWTANYAVMKGLGGMNCLPIGDSGINIALLQFKNIPKKNNRVQVEEVFRKFEGWKSYLVYYLWRSRREPL